MPTRMDHLRVFARIGWRGITGCCPALTSRSPLRKCRHYPGLRTVSIHARIYQCPIQAVAMDTQHPEQEVLEPDVIGMQLPRGALRRLEGIQRLAGEWE